MFIKNSLSKILTNVYMGIYLSVLGIIAGELLIFAGHVYLGLAVHIINLQAITVAIILGKFSPDTKNVLQSMLLPLQMRIINLAMPQFFTTTLLWYPLVYGVMYMSIYYITKHQNITSKEIGIDFKHWYIYFPAALLIGIAMAMLEFQILHPIPLILDMKLQNLLLISMVMFVFVGAVEELIFRSIFLTRLEKMFGMFKSLFLSSLLFGIMHSGYGLISEVVFATFFGFVLGFIFQRTRSFPFILLIHGTANVLLYGIFPIL